MAISTTQRIITPDLVLLSSAATVATAARSGQLSSAHKSAVAEAATPASSSGPRLNNTIWG